jgi:hypothetical protein
VFKEIMGFFVCDVTADSFDELHNIWIQWRKNKRVRKVIQNPDEAFTGMVETFFRVDIGALKFLPVSKGDVKLFAHNLDKYLKRIEKGDIGGSTLFWVTEAHAKRDPTIRKILTDYTSAGFNTKGREIKHKKLFKEIMLAMQNEAYKRGEWANITGVSKFIKTLTRDTDQAKANKLTRAIEKALEEKDVDAIMDLEKQQAILSKESSLKVFDELRKYIETDIPAIIESKRKAFRSEAEEFRKAGKKGRSEKAFKQAVAKRIKIKREDIIDLVDVDGKKISENMVKAITKYSELTDDLFRYLELGIKAKISTIVEKTKGTNIVDETKIRDLEKRLLKSMLPDYEAGFYPHYTMDLNNTFNQGLMPHLDALENATDKFVLDRKITLKDALKDINTYISDHAKRRKTQATFRYSPNFVDSIGRYIRDVNNFNYISHIDMYHAQALNSIGRLYKGTEAGLEGYAKSIHDFISSMHMSASGRRDLQENPHMRAFMRTILGFEFVSKMGINIRGAARNFTQRLLDYIEWGPIQSRKMKKFFEDNDLIRQELEKFAKEKGYLFAEGAAELEESIGRAETIRTRRFNTETGKYETVDVPKLEKVASALAWLGGKAAFIHRRVENSNRINSLKIGYAQMYKWLETPSFDDFVRNVRREGKVTSDEQIESIRRNYARNYAERMMVANHFDYNDFSKAGVLTKPLGRVIGQFQHFAFAFAERSWDIMKKGGADIVAGDLRGHNAMKAYSYSMIYFLAPVLASIVTGLEWGNLVENDTKRRAEEMFAWMVGDEEDRKRVFYGRGPVMGNIGAPVISDLLTIGQLMEWINLDEDSILALLAGYKDMSNISTDKATYEKIRLLNTALARFAFREVPQIIEGRIGWAMQQELGLYKTKKARDIQEVAKTKEIEQIITSLEQIGSAKK